MSGSIQTFVLDGVEAQACVAEVAIVRGKTARTTIVGLPDTAVREAVERVQGAMAAGGFPYPEGPGCAGRCGPRRSPDDPGERPRDRERRAFGGGEWIACHVAPGVPERRCGEAAGVLNSSSSLRRLAFLRPSMVDANSGGWDIPSPATILNPR